MDSWLIEGVQLRADGRKVQAQDFSGSKADLGQVLQGVLNSHSSSPNTNLQICAERWFLLF